MIRVSPGKPGPVNSGDVLPKRHDDRRAQRRRDVHRPGIIRQKHAAKFQKRHQFAQRSFASQIKNCEIASCELRIRFGLSIAESLFSAEQNPDAICSLLDFLRGRDKFFHRPAFGRAVFRAGIQSENRLEIFSSPNFFFAASISSGVTNNCGGSGSGFAPSAAAKCRYS